MVKNILLVGAGGALGSVLRYATSLLLDRYTASTFPWATFTVNILGCFVIGLLLGLSGREQGLGAEYRSLLIVGFCGGYTTFSAFALENFRLMESGQVGWALSYSLASVVLGVLAVWGGLLLLR